MFLFVSDIGGALTPPWYVYISISVTWWYIVVHIFSNYVLFVRYNKYCIKCYTLNFPFWFWDSSDVAIKQKYSAFFFNSIKLLLSSSRVSECVVWECIQTCVCVTTCVFWYRSICIWLFLPWEATKWNSVTLWWENRLDYKIPSTCANWVLESLIWHLLEYYVICKWSVHQNKNPSPYFAALSLPSPVLQVCNVWAQFLGEFPICLCACYLWQRTVPGRQL